MLHLDNMKLVYIIASYAGLAIAVPQNTVTDPSDITISRTVATSPATIVCFGQMDDDVRHLRKFYRMLDVILI